MERLVIIPCIHVAGNEGRGNRDPFDFVLVGFEDAFEAAFWVEIFEFGAIAEIDQNRVSAAVLVRWDEQFSTLFPLGNQGRYDGRRNCRVVGERD